MVRISKIRSTQELLDRLWSRSRKPDSSWGGRGSDLLRLQPPVEREVLQNLLNGFGPNGGLTFVRASGEQPLGLQVDFIAPKSVSAFWAIAPNPEAHRLQGFSRAAAEFSSFHLEPALNWNGGMSRPSVPSRKAAVFAIFHENISAGSDPHLRTTVVAPDFDDRFSQINQGTIDRIQSHLDFVYHRRLRSLLENNLGVVTESTHNEFKVVGVPKEICDHFSRDIAPHFSVPSELVQCWQNEAEALGWGPTKAAELLNGKREQKFFSERFDLRLRESNFAERIRRASGKEQAEPEEVQGESKRDHNDSDEMEHSH